MNETIELPEELKALQISFAVLGNHQESWCEVYAFSSFN